MADGNTFTLAGRAYKPVLPAPLSRDFWLMARLRAAGLTELILEADEAPDEFVARMLAQVTERGQMTEILGALLMPAEKATKEWTPAMAAETGRALLALEDPNDKTTVMATIAATLAALIEGGLVVLKRIQPAKEVTHANES